MNAMAPSIGSVQEIMQVFEGQFYTGIHPWEKIGVTKLIQKKPPAGMCLLLRHYIGRGWNFLILPEGQLLSFQDSNGKIVGMFGVLRIPVLPDSKPVRFPEIRKIGISLENLIDFGKVKVIGKWKGQGLDLLASNHEDFLYIKACSLL